MEFIPPVADAFEGLSKVIPIPDKSARDLPARTNYSLTVDNDNDDLQRQIFNALV